MRRPLRTYLRVASSFQADGAALTVTELDATPFWGHVCGRINPLTVPTAPPCPRTVGPMSLLPPLGTMAFLFVIILDDFPLYDVTGSLIRALLGYEIDGDVLRLHR